MKKFKYVPKWTPSAKRPIHLVFNNVFLILHIIELCHHSTYVRKLSFCSSAFARTYILSPTKEAFRLSLMKRFVIERIYNNDDHIFITYRLNHKYHNVGDLPACIYTDTTGTKFSEWYKHGQLHRDNDMPAVIKTAYKEWYQNGKLHRDNNMPAIMCDDGRQYWYFNGKQYIPMYVEFKELISILVVCASCLIISLIIEYIIHKTKILLNFM